MELYVVRHGETGYNKMGLLQGRTDIPLNENGVEQAKKTKKALEHVSFDRVISSPLMRAIKTASIIAPNKQIYIDPRLEERGLGEYEGKPSRIYDKDLYHHYFKNCTQKSVEGIQELIARIKNLIIELQKNYPEETILLVTHGGWMNGLLYCFEPIPEDGKLRRVKIRNGEFLKYSL